MKRAFVISALQSGAGKTTAALALMAAVMRRGHCVQPFKIGPDFIDPGLHRAVTGKISWNLDRWMCSDDYARAVYYNKSQGADVCIIEGAMGLFDGGTSSAAEMAKLLGLPVIVILDVRGTAETAAAFVKGIEAFDPDLVLAGVILNRTGSARHYSRVKEAIETRCSCRVLGGLPTDSQIRIPERHLGLYTAEDGVITSAFTEKLAEAAESCLDIEALLTVSSISREEFAPAYLTKASGCVGMRTIAVAHDSAFCFYYEDNLDCLKAAGAEIVFFSPIDEYKIPADIDALYLGGGYPELHAEGLSSNSSMLSSIRDYVENGGVVYGECGGFMYLSQGIVTLDRRFFPMTGVFPVKTKMAKKRVKLGYRQIILTMDSFLGKKGDTLRGHEFHYSEMETMPSSIETAYEGQDGTYGYRVNNCIGGYVHLHFAGRWGQPGR